MVLECSLGAEDIFWRFAAGDDIAVSVYVEG